jgi:hypothetical protein
MSLPFLFKLTAMTKSGLLAVEQIIQALLKRDPQLENWVPALTQRCVGSETSDLEVVRFRGSIGDHRETRRIGVVYGSS